MTTPDLLPIVTKLLDCVDFLPPPHADVRVVNLWGAAAALEELRQVVELAKASAKERSVGEGQ